MGRKKINYELKITNYGTSRLRSTSDSSYTPYPKPYTLFEGEFFTSFSMTDLPYPLFSKRVKGFLFSSLPFKIHPIASNHTSDKKKKHRFWAALLQLYHLDYSYSIASDGQIALHCGSSKYPLHSTHNSGSIT